MVTQREWWEFSGTPVTSEITTRIREFRGSGRTRYLMRERDVNTGAFLSASAVWTDYEGEMPTADYVVDAMSPGPTITEERRYALGLSQVESDFRPSYFHTDHLGTTRALTSSSTTASRHIYTAFGEPVSTTGLGSTRYGYVGAHGYESFADQLYQHVGARWYDPETGRFLQRDPAGILGGINLYVYGMNAPTIATDPGGKHPLVIIIIGAVIIAIDSGAGIAHAPGPDDITYPGMAGPSPASIIGGLLICMGVVESVTAWSEWEWRGSGPPGSGKGSYYNPRTGESLHPDPNHPTHGPHDDYRDPNGDWWRIYPDGTYEPK